MAVKPLTPIAQEIEDRIATLCDTSIEWVQGPPYGDGRCCAIYNGVSNEYVSGEVGDDMLLSVSDETKKFFDKYFEYLADVEPPFNSYIGDRPIATVVNFNDHIAKDRWEVVSLLEDALEWAIEEGV